MRRIVGLCAPPHSSLHFTLSASLTARRFPGLFGLESVKLLSGIYVNKYVEMDFMKLIGTVLAVCWHPGCALKGFASKLADV